MNSGSVQNLVQNLSILRSLNTNNFSGVGINGNTLNQGQDDHGEFKTKLTKELTGVVEQEIVNKIDKELNLQHSNDCNY